MKIFIWIIGILILCNFAFAQLNDQNLVAYYSFDDAFLTNNSLRTGHNLSVITGSPPRNTTSCKIAGCYNFDGVDDRLATIEDDTAFDFTTNFTVSAWLYQTSIPQTESVFMVKGKRSGTDVVAYELGSDINTANSIGFVVSSTGANFQSISSGTYNLKAWYHYVAMYNRTHLSLWVNGTQLTTVAYTSTLYNSGNPVWVGMGNVNDGVYKQFNGMIDELAVWNRSLTATEIQSLYNGGSGLAYPFSSTTADNINISTTYPANNDGFSASTINFNTSVSSVYNFNCSLYINSTLNDTRIDLSAGSSINVNFTKTMNDGIYNYYFYCIQGNDTSQNETSGTNTFIIDISPPNIANTTFNGNNTYWTNNLNLNVNITDNLQLKNLTITQTCGGNYQNLSLAGISYTFSNTTINISNCSIGTKYTNITVCDLLQCTTKYYHWENRASLNISVYDMITDSPVQNFDIYLNGTLKGSTASYTYLITNLTNSTDYNITAVAFGYAITDKLTTINSTVNFLNISVYTTNSISINIFDDINGSTIPETISIKFTTNTTEFTNITNSSAFYIDNLPIDTYTIQFSSASYSPRTYTITVGNNTHSFLNAFLTKSTSPTIFNIMSNTNVPLENVLITIYKVINGSWTPIESKYSDITGKAQFIYTLNTNYKFYMSKSNYTDIIFYLNPILLSSYDIKMIPTIIQTDYQDYTGVSIIYSPTLFYPGYNLFTFIIQSPSGYLIEYGYNISYPGGFNTSSGVNSIGSTLTNSIGIINPNINDKVKLDYYYISTTYGRRNFTMYYSISVNESYINNTFISNQNKTYGLGLIERLLIATLLIIFIAGIFAMVGNAIPGLVTGLMLYGWLVYIGFIPLWSILLSLTLGILILGLRGNS